MQMMMRSTCPGWIVGVLWLCCATAAVSAAERKTYDLRYRPAVGQRWAFEQSSDSTFNVQAGVNRANATTSKKEVRHSQLIVTCDEVLDVADGKCTAKRVTFGKGCFAFEQIDDQPRRDQRMVYSDKTVTFRMLADGTLDQDFGVKTNGRHMRLIRDAILGRTTFFPNQPVAIGDRWRADDVMRELMQLRASDTLSTIFTLKAVREQDGRQVADVTVTAAVLMTDRGMNLEVGIEGAFIVDVATGVPLKEDLIGRSNIAGSGPRGITMSGAGTFEFHRATRPLPPAPPQVADVK